MQGKQYSCLVWLSVAMTLCLASGCGRKTPVRPPEFVAPQRIEDLKLEAKGDGIELRWGRPRTYADGSRMEDLDGFVVLRSAQAKGEQASEFAPITTVIVEDRDRFQQAKRFEYTDKELMVGIRYRYQVQAFTLDRDYSTPSNTVELVWQGGS